MALPKDLVKPAVNFTHPSERPHMDTSKSTAEKLQVFDPAKTAKDYGEVDPAVVEPLAGKKSETGNGAGGG